MAITRAQRVQAQTHSNAARNALPDLEPGRFIWNGTSNKLEVYNGGSLGSRFTSKAAQSMAAASPAQSMAARSQAPLTVHC